MMVLLRWFSVLWLVAAAASPALAIRVIGDEPASPPATAAPAAPAAQIIAPPLAVPEAETGGLSTMETAVMLLGSLVFSAALLSRKPD